MATKHGKVVNLHENRQTINPHNPLNMCSQEVTWQTKNIISPQDLSKGDIPQGALTQILA